MSDEANNGHTCAAFGCPLPGALRGFDRGGDWLCFIHSSGACDLQATTARINAHAHPLRVMLKASNMAAHQWADAGNQRYIADVMRRHGLDALLPSPEERQKSAQSWSARARVALRSACFVADRRDLADRSESAPPEGGKPTSLKEFFSGLHPAETA